MELRESGEMYLEAILVLGQKSSFVRSVDVSEYLGYSKPSVSRAMGILRTGGFVLMDPDGGLSLTETGREIAEKIFERHTLLSQLLMALGVPEGTAIADACKMEHDLSVASFEGDENSISVVNLPNGWKVRVRRRGAALIVSAISPAFAIIIR